MFSTKQIGCFLNAFAGHGDDNEAKELKLVFHIAPITPDLAIEISPRMADRLFRSIGGEWEPAREITKASFASIQVPMQNITFHAMPDGLFDKGVLVPSAAISNLRAQRGDGPDFRLEFDVLFPMDRETMRLVEQYYKATAFLSMEPVQREIELSGGGDPTEQSLQEAADDIATDLDAAVTITDAMRGTETKGKSRKKRTRAK